MPSQGHQPAPLTPGRYYVRYPDGAFTMPMTYASARSHARVFSGRVRTNDPGLTEWAGWLVPKVECVLRWLVFGVAMFLLGYYGTDGACHAWMGLI